MTAGTLRITLLAALAVLVAALPAASASTRCSVARDGRKLGPTYTTSLTVSGTSCASGKRLVRAYYSCRKRHGGVRGRCTTRVSGYRCTERRANAIPTQFDATVRCARGSARVVHRYTQFT